MIRLRGLYAVSVAVALTGGWGCGKDKDKSKGEAKGQDQEGGNAASSTDDVPSADKPTGPSLPAISTKSGVTFAVAKDPSWWFTASFACYKGAIKMSPDGDVGAAFAQFPRLVPALQAGGLSLEDDVVAMGGFDCAGELCAYAAVAANDGSKLDALVTTFAGGESAVNKEADGHWSFPVEGAITPRTMHVFRYAVDWSSAGTIDDDAWAKDARRASHVLLFYGLDEGGKTIDPLEHIATQDEARKRLAEVEGMTEHAGGRCAAGEVDGRDFLDSFKLERARFVLGCPTSGGDAIAALLGTDRSLDFRVNLALSPEPTKGQAEAWVTMGKAWLDSTMGEVKMSMGAMGNPAADAIIGVIKLMLDRGFEYEVSGKHLRLSWRTNRIPAGDLAEFESKLQGFLQ